MAIAPAYLAGAAVARLFPAAATDQIERLFADFTGAWVAGLLAVVILFLAMELGASLRNAAVLGVVSILCTALWVESKTMFSEPLTALLITTAVLFAIRAARTSSVQAGLLSGLALGAAPMARSTSVLFAVPVGLYVLIETWRARSRWSRYLRVIAAFAAGTGLTLALFLASNWWRYGSPFNNGYPPQSFSTPPPIGLYGLFLSPGKGLFLYAPLALVAVIAVPLAFRRRPGGTLLLLGVFIVTIPVYATFHDWSGGNAWGPRYLYSVLPLLLVIAAPAMASIRWRRAVVVAAVAGVLVNVSGVLLYFNNELLWASSQIGPAGNAHDPTGETISDDDIHFDPRWSPLLGEPRLVPSALKNTVLELEGQHDAVAPFPSGASSRFGWYYEQRQVDLWWYLIVPTGAPLALELLAPVFIGCVGLGLVRLYRLS